MSFAYNQLQLPKLSKKYKNNKDRVNISLERKINNFKPSLALVLDDNIDQLDIMEVQLSHAGYSVITAENGAEGLDIALKRLPEIVITDTNMPIMDGPYFVKQLLSQYANKHPLGRDPFIIGTSDSSYFKQGKYDELQNNNDTNTMLKQLYVNVLGINGFIEKDKLNDYIGSNQLTKEFKLDRLKYEKANLYILPFCSR